MEIKINLDDLKSNSEKAKVTISIDIETYEQLLKYAKKRKVSFSALAELCLKALEEKIREEEGK